MKITSSASILMALVLILPVVLMLDPEHGEAMGDIPIGSLDSNIAGTVENGTSGIPVIIQTTKIPNGTGNPTILFFNGTTDATGSFNITVDSDLQDVYTLIPYTVRIESIYYKDATESIYNFDTPIQSGQIFHVPPGELECVDAETGTLEIRIYNKTIEDGNEIEGAVVTVSHIDQSPDIPFSQARITDQDGRVIYNDIRAINTSVEATKINFQPLSSTSQITNVEIAGSPTVTAANFILEEDPWPFNTDPSQGDTDGNVTRGVVVDFSQEMDETSINTTSNYRLVDDQGQDVDFTIVIPSNDNDRVILRPVQPMEYDTNHTLSIFARIRSFGGGKPLWRTMDVEFRTEKAPAVVSGRLVETGTTDPAFDVKVSLVDQTLETDIDGTFEFPLVIPGLHDLHVTEGYLFGGTEVEDLEISRGDIIDLGDLEVDPFPWGSMNVTLLSGGDPLQGGWVKVLSNMLDEEDLNLTTDETGLASFPRVRSGNVNIKVGAPHHDQKIEIVIVEESGTGEITMELREDPFPVTVSLTEEISPGIARTTSDLLVQMPEPILFQSLNVTLWKLDGEGNRSQELTLSPPQEGSVPNSYLIRVQGDLPLESSFELTISDELVSLAGGEKILWRELAFPFGTLELPLAFINGTLLIEGKALQGVEIEFIGQSGTTEEDGSFNISIDLDAPTVSDILIINLSMMGYQPYTEEIELSSGDTYQIGTIDLLPMDDWFTMSPIPGSTDVDPETTVNLTLTSKIVDVESEIQARVKLVKEGTSAPLSVSYSITNGNLSLVLVPDTDLEDGTLYQLVIEDSLLQENGLPFFPVGKVLSFRTRPPAIRIEVIEPAEDELDDVEIDGSIRLSFGYPMNRTKVMNSMTVSPEVSLERFNWLSSSELSYSAVFMPNTEYTLSLPPDVYGLSDEPLGTQFQLSFTTGDQYGKDHTFTSINLIPEPETGWETSQTIRVSGTVENSAGYTILVKLGTGDDALTFTTKVLEDGTWSINITLPDEEMKGTFTVGIGVSSSSLAYQRDYDVEIKDPGQVDGQDDPADMTLYYILGAVLLLIIVILAAALYVRNQKKKAEEASDIDYTDVDVDDDWEDDEE